MARQKMSLRDILKDIYNYFHLQSGDNKEKLNLLDIHADSIVIDMPSNMPKGHTIRGYIQRQSGNLFYSIEGVIETSPLPGQKPNTLRIKVDPSRVKSLDRRLFPRHVFLMQPDAMIVSQDEGEVLSGSVINLSPAGVRIEVPEQLSLEKIYLVTFEIALDGIIYSLALSGRPLSETMLSESFAYGLELGNQPSDRSVTIEDGTDSPPNVELTTLIDRLIKRS